MAAPQKVKHNPTLLTENWFYLEVIRKNEVRKQKSLITVF